jgi:ketosteroid isomerase-like protein
MNSFGPRLRIICLGLLWVGGLWAQASAAGEAPCEAGVRRSLQAYCKAFAAKDVEGVLDCFSDTFSGSHYPYTKKDLRETLERLVRVSRSMSLSFEYLEFRCAGDYALVTATQTLIHEPYDQIKPEETVTTRQYQLERQDDRWRLMWDYVLLPDMPAPPAGQEYKLPQQGFALTAPRGFSYRMCQATGGVPTLVGVAGDLKKWIVIKGSDVGVTIHPEQLGDIVENEIELLFPDCRVTNKKLSEVSGLPAVMIDVECPQFRGSTWGRVALVLDRKNLLVVSVDAVDQSLGEEVRADLERALAGLHRIAKEPLASGACTLVKGGYRNPEYGLSITLPEGWEAVVGEKGALVTAKAPSGMGVIRVKVIDLLENDDAMTLIERDDKTASQIFAGYACERRLPLKVGSLVGAQSLSRFDLGDGVKIWRICFTRSRRAFFIECEAQPSEEFEKLEPAFRRAVESFSLGKPCGTGKTR